MRRLSVLSGVNSLMTTTVRHLCYYLLVICVTYTCILLIVYGICVYIQYIGGRLRLSEAEVRWMIDTCGGTVLNALDYPPTSTANPNTHSDPPQISTSRKHHIYLALYRGCKVERDVNSTDKNRSELSCVHNMNNNSAHYHNNTIDLTDEPAIGEEKGNNNTMSYTCLYSLSWLFDVICTQTAIPVRESRRYIIS